jgi:hypothetical protein
MKMQLKIHLTDLKMEAQKIGLTINYDKTKYIESGKPTKEKYTRINNRDTEKNNQFKYLGSIFTYKTEPCEARFHGLLTRLYAMRFS